MIDRLAKELEREKLKHIAATEHNKISLQFLAEETKHRTAAESRTLTIEAETREACAVIAESWLQIHEPHQHTYAAINLAVKNVATAIRAAGKETA